MYLKDKTTALPFHVNRAVVALCGDYDRRAFELRRGKLPEETLEYYRMLNESIDSAIQEFCEHSICEQLRYEIGCGIGHRRSQLYFLSPESYKNRKRHSKYRIAQKLHLI